jgi:alkylated DNA repair protein (DNA oxidative demethylase)
VVAPGAVHLPGWLDREGQRGLVDSCRAWAAGAGGLRAPRMPQGGVMSVEIVCLGWHWLPYRYSRTVDDGDGRPVQAFPAWLGELSRRALADAVTVDPRVAAPSGGTAPLGRKAQPDGRARSDRSPAPEAGYRPDVALVNWYGAGARMGMHADRDERCPAPVVSVSLGDSCRFRFGTPAGRGRPWVDVTLESGDLFVFGGPSRLAFHGVPKVLAGTGDPGIGLSEGRFNLTVRQSGLPAGT